MVFSGSNTRVAVAIQGLMGSTQVHRTKSSKLPHLSENGIISSTQANYTP